MPMFCETNFFDNNEPISSFTSIFIIVLNILPLFLNKFSILLFQNSQIVIIIWIYILLIINGIFSCLFHIMKDKKKWELLDSLTMQMAVFSSILVIVNNYIENKQKIIHYRINIFIYLIFLLFPFIIQIIDMYEIKNFSGHSFSLGNIFFGLGLLTICIMIFVMYYVTHKIKIQEKKLYVYIWVGMMFFIIGIFSWFITEYLCKQIGWYAYIGHSVWHITIAYGSVLWIQSLLYLTIQNKISFNIHCFLKKNNVKLWIQCIYVIFCIIECQDIQQIKNLSQSKLIKLQKNNRNHIYAII